AAFCRVRMLASRPIGRVLTGPFFLADRFPADSRCFRWMARAEVGHAYRTDTALMGWQDTVAQTVTGLGFDLVDLERSAGGLLRVTIDMPWTPPAEGAEPAPEQFVTVEDCETVTRQLQYLLEVEGVDYQRLEVGSPGIDRPLRHEFDFLRFAGQVVDI